jgi:hypothetical protein
MRGEKESTRKTFAAKLAVSGKERTWIMDDRRATGSSNIHAFRVLSGFFLSRRKIELHAKTGILARMKALEIQGRYRSPAAEEAVTDAGTDNKHHTTYFKAHQLVAAQQSDTASCT